MIKAIVFDLDDTLYFEKDYCRSGFKAVSTELAKRKGFPRADELLEAMWKQFTEGNYGYAFNAALDQFGISVNQQIIDELIQIYRNHYPCLELPIQSRQVLDRLKPDYKLALLTDGFLPAQEYKVKALGIQEYFECIVYTEAMGREFWKPSPVGFQKIVSELDVKATECVYVADNLAKDFIGPNLLGYKTIYYKSDNGIHNKPNADPNAQPDYEIKSLLELPGLVARL